MILERCSLGLLACFQLESEGSQWVSKGVHLVCLCLTWVRRFPMIFYRCTLGLLASNLNEKVANDFLKVYISFACFQLELEGVRFFAHFELEEQTTTQLLTWIDCWPSLFLMVQTTTQLLTWIDCWPSLFLTVQTTTQLLTWIVCWSSLFLTVKTTTQLLTLIVELGYGIWSPGAG